jgi:hypothetical protein
MLKMKFYLYPDPYEVFRYCVKGDYRYHNPATDTQWDYKYVVSSVDDKMELWIRFEESQSNLDWLQNFNARKIRLHKNDRFKVHKGFATKFLSVRDEIYSILELNNYDRLILSGFSQGGALAQMLHYDIVRRTGKEPYATYTFASPRVMSTSITGKTKYVNDYFSCNLRRFVLGNDGVTRMPPIWMGFRHIGTKVQIGKKPRFFQKILPRFRDHNPKKYRKALDITYNM